MKWKKFLLFAVAVAGGAVIWWALDLPTIRVKDHAPTTAPVDIAPPPVSAPSNSQPTPAPAPAAASDSELPPPVDLDAADRDLDLFGVVVNEAHAPVAGALVEAVTYPWTRANMLVELELVSAARMGPSTKTAADGTFSLRLERGQTVNLRVTATSYARTERTCCLAGGRVEIVLGAPAHLEVIVTDPTGAPAADVILRMWLVESMGTAHSIREKRSGVTNEQGRFVFVDLQRGDGFLEAEHVTRGSPEWTQITIDQPGTKTIQVQMFEGRTVSGHVHDAISGNPITGAHVGSNWVLSRPVLTDGSGNYEFPGWTGKGVSDLHATAEGYGRQGKKVPEGGQVDFDLFPGDELQAQLVSEDREPIADARVTAIASERRPQAGGATQELDLRSTTSGSDGSFKLTSLRADLGHLLVIQAAGFGRSLFYFDHSMATDGVIRLGMITLPGGQRIEGVVVSREGVPVARTMAKVDGYNSDLSRFGQAPAGFAEELHNGTTEQTATDDLGRFRFADLAPGEYAVSLLLSGSIGESKSVVLAPGQDVSDLRFELGGGENLTVRLVDDAGNAVPGARVMLFSERKSVYENTNPDGEVNFRDLPTGDLSMQVSASAGYLAPPTQSVTPGGQTITVTLETASHISGSVHAPDGAPLVGLQLSATSRADASNRYGGMTRENGTFTFSLPRQISVDIEVSGKIGEMTWLGSAQCITSPASDVLIHAELVMFDRTLRVRVLNHDGTPLAGIPIVLMGKFRRSPVREPGTDQNGLAEFSGLPADELQLMCFPPLISLPEDAVIPEPLKLTPGGQEVTVQYRKGIVMRGRTVNEQGESIAGAHIVGPWNGKQWFTAVSDAEGAFTFALLPDSTIDLNATGADAEQNPITGKLPGVTDRSSEITIVLKKP